MQDWLDEVDEIYSVPLIQSYHHSNIDKSENNFLLACLQNTSYFLFLHFAVFEKFSQNISLQGSQGEILF